MWHYGYGSASWLWMAGMMTLMSVLTAFVIIAIVRATRSSDGGVGAADRARRTLDERYARGELGHDEYEERRRRLTATEPTRRDPNPRP